MKEADNIISEFRYLITQIEGNLNHLSGYLNQKPNPIDDKLYTSKSLCDHLKISKRALQGYRDKGLIPYIRLGGKVLFRDSDIKKLLNDNYYDPKKGLL